MKRRWVLVLTVAVLLGLSGAADADLTTIGTASYGGTDYNLIYEGELGGSGLVWLDYTKSYNYWQNQVNWASGLGGYLTVTLDPGYTTDIDWSTGWRLPITDESKAKLSGGFGYAGPDGTGYHNYRYGYNMVNSEMGHLFYESLGNKGYYATDGTQPQPGWGLQNTGDFNNLQAVDYWSGTEYSPDPYGAWDFYFGNGGQSVGSKGIGNLALAVCPGDVSAVPEPATMLLLASGLAGLGAIRKGTRRRRG